MSLSIYSIVTASALDDATLRQLRHVLADGDVCRHRYTYRLTLGGRTRRAVDASLGSPVGHYRPVDFGSGITLG